MSLCSATHARITLATPCLFCLSRNFFFYQYVAKLQPMPGYGERKTVLHSWEKWESVWDLGVLHRIWWGSKGKCMLFKLIKHSSFLNWAVLFLQEPCCRQNPFVFPSPSHRTAGEVCHHHLWTACKRQRCTLHCQISEIVYKDFQSLLKAGA